MVGNTAHRNFLLGAPVPPGQCNLKLFGGQDCILEEHFIEIAQPEKQKRVLRFRLDS
ncbi:hypothetical protein D3C81_1131490 [compost metagenome]